MSKLRAMACILALGSALAYTGCSDDLDDKPGFGPFPVPDAGAADAGTDPDAGTNPDAGTDAGTDGGTQFSTFVRDLIENQTTEATTPVETENRNFTDDESSASFPETFFQ